MKKRNVMTMALSLALVGVIGVGSTLAYLTAKDGTLTNTFEFAGNIVVDVYETSDDAFADVKSTGSGVNSAGRIEYENLVPGQSLKKDVDVKLTSTVDTDLYVLIDTGVDTEATLAMDLNESEITTNGWKPVAITENGKYLYKQVGIKGDAYQVFQTVTVPDVLLTGETTKTLNNIVINVYAVQSDNLADDVTADSLAAAALGVTLPQA